MLPKPEMNKKDTSRHDNVNRGTAQAILNLERKDYKPPRKSENGKNRFPREEHTEYNFF